MKVPDEPSDELFEALYLIDSMLPFVLAVLKQRPLALHEHNAFWIHFDRLSALLSQQSENNFIDVHDPAFNEFSGMLLARQHPKDYVDYYEKDEPLEYDRDEE